MQNRGNYVAQHKTQADGEWFKRSFLEQMANIGSEVFRATKWKSENNIEYADLAFLRSLELIDLTKQSKVITGPQLKELCRFREIWVNFFWFENIYGYTDEVINKYFMYLTIAYQNKQKGNW